MAGKAHETCCTSLAAHPQSPAYRGSQGVAGWCQEKKANLGPVGVQGRGREDPQASVSLVGLKEKLPWQDPLGHPYNCQRTDSVWPSGTSVVP